MTSARMTGRFADPSITSVIFAPKPQNYTLASVSFDERLPETLGLEWWVDPEEFPSQPMLGGFGWAQLEWLISEYLRSYIKTLTTSAAVSVSSEIEAHTYSVVPARTYPFTTHLSLLGGAIEGVFVDPEESSEH